MKKIIFILMTIAITACSTPTPLFTADGRPTQHVTCLNNVKTQNAWQECERKAQTICPKNNYDVIAREITKDGRTMYFACRL